MAKISTTHVNASLFTPDPYNPLHLFSSDIPEVSLVTIPLAGSGFGGLHRNMIVSLSARNKLAFVDGSCPKHVEDSPQLQQWNMCNNMVISWLTNSLSPDIAESVQYSEIAESIWTQLNKRYGSVDGTKVFELKKELASSFQGCSCPIKSNLQKEKEEDKVHQFLMGLNDAYVGARSNLLMMHHLPSLDSSYNILLQDERQR
ncbi:uncharacterized protein [Nicotiana tomentosiformis]|uniref:uncharacterized protein n=1 Tax=Nicotiana tomentosiformis TaxID=4098 RepID=UPI00051B39B9|nr:uncharacterized protein LOC104107118 [Nicotiana tomentosiformis]